MIREINKKSRQQTILSIVILSVLMVIGVGILFTQSRYNPAVMQKDAFIPKSNPDKASSPLSPDASFVPLPEGIQPLTETEIFDTRNLSDKINGKAEFYLSAGFTRLVAQRYKDKRETDLWLEAFVYDMGNHQNAYSVFSAQRREDAESLDLAQYAYRTPNALFLIHGRYYVEIIASKISGKVLGPLQMMAETFIRNTPAEKTGVNEMELFPQQELVKNSIVLIPSDAFGYEGFNKIYTAEYKFDDHSFMAYLSHRRTPSEAKELASAYTAFLSAYGGKNIEAQIPIKGARLIEILDTYEIVFYHGSYVAGIREAASIQQAKTLALRLYSRIKEGGQ